MLGLKLNKKNTYIVACSFGAASMCLLDTLIKESFKLVVCYIDYHSEKSMQKFNNLKDFCEKHNVVIEYLDSEKIQETEETKKAEEARIIRYSFFKSIYDKYDAAGLFVSHNQDDLLESYLLKKQEGITSENYGWEVVSKQLGMMVYRPLLQYSNEDILEYNSTNHVPYQIASEEEQVLSRHPIQRQIISKLSEIDRDNLLNEMTSEISDKKEYIQGINKRVDTGGELDVREIIALNSNEFAQVIGNFISMFEEDIKITSELLSSIRQMCLSQEENCSIQLSNTLFITKEYDVLTIGGNLAKPLYSYTLAKPGKLKTDYFELDFSNGAADRGFRLSDYPLTIRPAVPEDLFNVHGFMTPVRKLYYDWRMPPKKKVIWPVLANKYGEIIYIPRYHRLHRTDHTSKFEIKFSEDDN